MRYAPGAASCRSCTPQLFIIFIQQSDLRYAGAATCAIVVFRRAAVIIFLFSSPIIVLQKLVDCKS
jgi:hypothetical protein